MLRWLHISDLHFNDDDMSTVSLREELPGFLKKNGARCDYVFCTGDIRTANASPNNFTDEAAQYLVGLCSAVGVTTDRLFIVPGNHDVDRNAAGRHDAVRRICFHRSGYYDPKYGKIEEVDLQAISAGQKDFREFLAKIFSAERIEMYADPLRPHFNVETPDFNILHIDSTLTYTKDQEASDLIIGTKLLQNALRTINPEKPTILLTHYPFTSLLQEEKKYVRELLQKKGVRLWLAGHEHDHMVQPIGYFDSLQAGELRVEDRTNATVLLGEFNEITNSGYVTAYTWLNLLKGIQFVISSRSDFTARYSMAGYRTGRLIPLSDEQVKTVFSSEEWSGIQDVFTLRRLLSNPMMVTMYKEISPIIKQSKDEACLGWIIPIQNATDLLYDYYVAQLAVLLQRSGVDGQKVQQAYQIVFEVLPALAYGYESSYSLNKGNAEFNTLLRQILQEHCADEKSIFPLQERFRDYDLPGLSLGAVLDFLMRRKNTAESERISNVEGLRSARWTC